MAEISFLSVAETSAIFHIEKEEKPEVRRRNINLNLLLSGA
jgi:hypothetical protein